MPGMKSHRLFALTALVLIVSCRHGIEIVGEGRVSSATGDRDCIGAASPCTFEITDDYFETYTAIPDQGNVFDSWSLCLQSKGNVCTFSVPKNTVEDYAGQTMPPTVAKFRKPIEPLFPTGNDGKVVLPDTPAANQFAWFLDELSQGSTSTGEITQHFSENFLQNAASAEQMRDLIDNLRAAVPNAKAIDMITVTPNFIRAIIGLPETPSIGYFVSLTTEYAQGAAITSFSASGYPQTAAFTFPQDSNLSYGEVRNKFKKMAQNTSMLVANIDSNRCEPVFKHRAKAVMPTASIFKIWVLAALAKAIEDGDIDINSTVKLVESELVFAGATINNVPLGTNIPLVDMSALMMGRSDNTATDHIHELVGRDKIEKITKAFNKNRAHGLTPFLSLNEQFQVLAGLSPQQAQDYADGNDKAQRSILNSLIVPLGPVTAFTYNNEDILRTSSWRASTLDVCNGIAGLRQFDNRSEAFSIIDTSFGAEVVLPTLRRNWDRAWFKGGGLANAQGNYVSTMSWLLESDDRGAHVIVLMANNDDGSGIDLSGMYSLASRIAEILDAKN